MVVAVVVFGGMVYETVAARLAVSRSNAVIDQLHADYAKLDASLVLAQAGVANLTDALEEAERANTQLGNELEESQRVAGILGEFSKEFGAILIESAGTATDLSGTNRLLGESIKRNIEYADRL